MRCAGLCLLLALGAGNARAQWGGELRLAIRSEPRSLDPALVESDGEETFRYLTGGVLVRVNRVTQELEPEFGHFLEHGKGWPGDRLSLAIGGLLLRRNSLLG